MAAKTGKKISNAVVWVILVLLIIGLAGFGATSFGGSVGAIGSVGRTDISTDRYARALQQEIRGFEAQTRQRIPFAQAQQLGLDRVVLQRLVAITALEDEATELGISVGDAAVRDQVISVPAFQGLDGQFDRDAYEFALRNAGQTVAEYERDIRSETGRTLLQGALIAGIQPPDIYVDTLYDFARETRDLTILRIGRADLDAPISAPTDAQLQTFYDENPDSFTLPERKEITYAWVRPEMVAGAIQTDEDVLRRLYDERAAAYILPDRRLVERLVFPDQAAADVAADAIAAGETDFDALVAERGLTTNDVDLGEVTEDSLGAAAESVFALDAPGIAGPAPSSLGPALYRVNAILPAQETTFEEARDNLQAESSASAARRLIEDEIETIEDLLASGATLEEIADETLLELGQMAFSEDDADIEQHAIDGYNEFRRVAASVQDGDFAELAELSDGGVFALRLDGIIAPSLQPFADVEVAVIDAWERAELQKRTLALAETVKSALGDDVTLEEQPGDLRVEEGLMRDAFVEDAPVQLVTTAFEMEPGEVEILQAEDAAILLRLDQITAPDGDSDEARELKDAFTRQTGQGLAQDITQAFTDALQQSKGISLNSQAVNAVNAQFQ